MPQLPVHGEFALLQLPVLGDVALLQLLDLGLALLLLALNVTDQGWIRGFFNSSLGLLIIMLTILLPSLSLRVEYSSSLRSNTSLALPTLSVFSLSLI